MLFILRIDEGFTVFARCRSSMDRSILYNEDVAIREGLLAARNKPFISIFIIINQIARSAKREEMKL